MAVKPPEPSMSHSTNEPRHAVWLVPAAMATVVGCLAAFGATPQDAMSMEEGEMVMGSDESDTRFSSDEIHFFEAKVRPLLISACSGCHSDTGSRIRGGFEIDTRAAMVRGFGRVQGTASRHPMFHKMVRRVSTGSLL